MIVKILSAGVVILHWNRDHYDYLLLRAYNYWDFPKGTVEPGETSLEGALREVKEETAITDLQFRWGYVYRETPPYNYGRKVARYYIAATATTSVHLPVNPLLGRPEHSAYRWAGRTEAWRLLTPRVRMILEWTDEVLGLKPMPRNS
jgi:bis(5'-nucleosidyl)-tetraphosphatase